jgi:predicted dehydrogenase/nucleoside-diphosphate-sugar epimerase
VTRASEPTPRIAVVGCGAIAEAFHVPALARHESIRSELVLVDPDLPRARDLARRFGAGGACADIREVLDRIDGAIVAVPPRLHHPIGLACIRAGVHVLCEKPLAETPEAARELVDVADREGVALAVNQTRRLFPSFLKVRELLRSGAIGRPERIEYQMGEPFDWPAATASYFGAAGSKKGVLLDTGAHILDLVCWWLGEKPELSDYRDDSSGGTEAVAQISLRTRECEARVRLSWLSKLANRYRIEGEAGSIEGGAYEWSSLTLRDAAGRGRKLRVGERGLGFDDLANRLIDNFLDVVRGLAEPLVPGAEVLSSIELIEACYQQRSRFDLPWNVNVSTAWSSPGTGPVLVTGAGGFVGGRVVEILHDSGYPVRAGVRRWSSAARIGRLPVEIVQCDVTDPEQLRRATDGAQAVVHCAVGDHNVTVEGTRRLLEASRAAAIQRIVHISTIDVYGAESGEIHEDQPLRSGNSTYGDDKIAAERVCSEFVERGLPVCILRPTLIYGPFSASWTIEWAMRLQARPWLLSEEDSRGTCNLLYVDDLVAAVMLALENDEAVGEAFNINGGERPTWQEYFDTLNAELGLQPLVTSSPTASRLSAGAMQPVRSTAKFLLSHFEDRIMSIYQRSDVAKALMLRAEGMIRKTPTTAEFGMLGRTASYATEKAARMLGYKPRFSMADGAKRSAQWLRHHGYVGETSPR